MTGGDLRFLLEDKKTGQKWISGKCWEQLNAEIKQLQRESRDIHNQLCILKVKVRALEKPRRLEEILEFIGDKKRDFHSIVFNTQCLYSDVETLEKEGKIILSKAGNHYMYSISEEV